MRIEPWRVSQTSATDDFCESVFFTGNGHLGARGFGAWAVKDKPQAHAVFAAGLFSEIKPGITDMVQLPDLLTLIPVDEAPHAAEQTLDLRAGTLIHRWETPRAEIVMTRAASMADSQLLLQKLTLTAKREGAYTVRAVESPLTANLPVHDDQAVIATELKTLLECAELTPRAMRLRTLAEGTQIRLSWSFSGDCDAPAIDGVTDGQAVTEWIKRLAPGESWTVEKRVRVLLGDEKAHADTPDPWQGSAQSWEALWHDCDIEVEADDPALQGALRYNLYQLLANDDADNPGASIGARGLTHGRYKGNAFWDTDVFLLPFYLWTRPQAALSLVRFRSDRLDAARALAKRQNLAGARYPWMCASDGREQCESWDIGQCETHITADVAYAMARYLEVTGDEDYRPAAEEVWRDTARYWLSRLTYEPATDRYSSFFVKGPDEYCGATVNNTFTNYMARGNLRLALPTLTGEERARAERAAERVTILYDEQRALYLQDELLDRLEPAPFLKQGDTPSYASVCFDRMQRYRVLKQADLVLLMTLCPKDFTDTQKRNVFAYYEPITLHDSTLSYGAHAQLALRLGLWEKAEAYLRKAIYLDLNDVMGNTGREGLHMAALGAAWQAIVFGAAGVWSENGQLTVEPMLPPGIHRLRMRLIHRGKRYQLDLTHDRPLVKEEE